MRYWATVLLRGIRIGVATVKAFLDVTTKQAVGITSLEALAYNVQQDDSYICSLIDAKNDNVYGGFFKKKNGQWHQVGELVFDHIDHLLEELNNQPIMFVGNGSIAYKAIIKSKLPNAEFVSEKENKLNARNVGMAAYYQQQKAVDSTHLKPLSLRQSNAERNEENTSHIEGK